MTESLAAARRGRVLVTGASGFIGTHLMHGLADLGAVAANRRLLIAGQGGQPPTLDGIDTIIHAAGRAHVLRETESDPLRAFREGNVETTRQAVRAAVAAGARRFILLSSVAVYGEGGDQATWTASTPLAPVTPYGVSRKEAEEVAVAEAGGGLDVIMLRLPMVYGPGMKGNPLRLFDLIHSGRPIPLGAVRNTRSTLYVGNVVFAVRRLAEAPVNGPSASTFLVADEGTVSTPQFVREIAQALGRPARLWSVPMPVLRLAARVGAAALGQRFPLTPDALGRLSGSLVVDASPLARAIGAPPVSRGQGLRETAEWYLQRS